MCGLRRELGRALGLGLLGLPFLSFRLALLSQDLLLFVFLLFFFPLPSLFLPSPFSLFLLLTANSARGLLGLEVRPLGDELNLTPHELFELVG